MIDVFDPERQTINLNVIEEYLKGASKVPKCGIIVALSYGEVNTVRSNLEYIIRSRIYVFWF